MCVGGGEGGVGPPQFNFLPFINVGRETPFLVKYEIQALLLFLKTIYFDTHKKAINPRTYIELAKMRKRTS